MSKDNPDKSTPKSKDVALVYGRSEAGLHILRQREQRLEKGVIRPLEEGKPIEGEVVRLKQRVAGTPVYDVEVQYEGQVHRGRGVSTDSIEASARAFLNAMNRVAVRHDRLHPQR